MKPRGCLDPCAEGTFEPVWGIVPVAPVSLEGEPVFFGHRPRLWGSELWVCSSGCWSLTPFDVFFLFWGVMGLMWGWWFRGFGS